MCKQLLTHILHKMGRCSCFCWTPPLHLKTDHNNNDKNGDANHEDDNDMQFKSCRSIIVSVIPSSSSSSAKTDNNNNNSNSNNNGYGYGNDEDDNDMQFKSCRSIIVSVIPSSSSSSAKTENNNNSNSNNNGYGYGNDEDDNEMNSSLVDRLLCRLYPLRRLLRRLDTEASKIMEEPILGGSGPKNVIGSKTEPILGISIPKGVTGSKNEAQIFNYRELATATNNFRSESFIGEGGFGPVYKGKLERTGQIVAVKKLNQTGIQGDKEFLVEVLMLSLLRHPNLVNLIGYCAEGNQRLLVYEYLPLGSLADHLHDYCSVDSPLDWNTRMKVAAGAAEGLEYLHNKAEPSVIYRDLKSANILLDEGFYPRLSDFGLAKFGPEGDKSHVSTRVMGTQGYCAPEYAVTGKLTKMSDIFSFGVVLLELITGQQAIDPRRGHGKLLLVDWAHPMLIDSEKFLLLADPKLKGQFPETVLCNVVEVASMCVRENPHARPRIDDIVSALKYLSSRRYNPNEAQKRYKGDRTRKRPQKDDSKKDDDVKVHSGGAENDRDVAERNKDLERRRAVEEAKMWGATWREKKPE